MIKINLPWPPSINRYWRQANGKVYISKNGKLFRDRVYYLSRPYHYYFKKTDRLAVKILAFPPDKRRRDIDNILKAALDALEHANVFDNDNQIDDLQVIRQKEQNKEIIVYLSTIA